MITESANLTTREFEELAGEVYRHCGIDLHDGKAELVRARLARQMRLNNFDSANEYLGHVRADASGHAFQDLVDALSTNLTSFFRENAHFDYLVKQLLPSLKESKRQRGSNSIRAWSAGCSTGEEPYTLAMTLLEHASPDDRWDPLLLATDISTRVLKSARAGVYERDRVESIPPALRGKYFTADRTGTTYEATAKLKERIAFRHLNLMQDWPFKGPFDFIFCRNVMIYFDKPTQERLVRRFHGMLSPGGMLFTGHSESLTGIKHEFKYVLPTIYAKA